MIIMKNNGWNKIIRHDATKTFPLEDSCIDVVITSPPYWGLRDYGVDGQIGLEKHPSEYIDHIVQVANEVKRVLKKTGSFYLNIGDTYFGSGAGTDKSNQEPVGKHVYKLPYGSCKTRSSRKNISSWLQPKQLMLIPSRVAIALQDDGWILRNDIIWHKPNPMPSSVKDRLNCTFEHVFHFVKSKKYYYNLDSIREPHKYVSLKRVSQNLGNPILNTDRKRGHPMGADTLDPKQFLHKNGKNPGDVFANTGLTKEAQRLYNHDHDGRGYHELGKNPGDFWDICTQPFTSFNDSMEHFAVFPEELIIKPLKASCPIGGVVLDPFCGRGTVGRVAKDLGLNYVLFDLNPDYVELAHLYVNGQKRKLIDYQQRLNYREK